MNITSVNDVTNPKDVNIPEQGDTAVDGKCTMLASKIANRMLLRERVELRAENSELTNDVLALLEDYEEIKNKLELQERQNEQLLRTVELLSEECDSLTVKAQHQEHDQIPHQLETIEIRMREKLRNAAMERTMFQDKITELERNADRMERCLRSMQTQSSISSKMSRNASSPKQVGSRRRHGSSPCLSSISCPTQVRSCQTFYEDFRANSQVGSMADIAEEPDLSAPGMKNSVDSALWMLKEKLGYNVSTDSDTDNHDSVTVSKNATWSRIQAPIVDVSNRKDIQTNPFLECMLNEVATMTAERTNVQRTKSSYF
jgi:hypothetical protein